MVYPDVSFYWTPGGIFSQPPREGVDYFNTLGEVVNFIKCGNGLLKGRDELEALVRKMKDESPRERAKTFYNRIVLSSNIDGRLPVRVGDEWYVLTRVKYQYDPRPFSTSSTMIRTISMKFMDGPCRKVEFAGSRDAIINSLSDFIDHRDSKLWLFILLARMMHTYMPRKITFKVV